MKRKLIVFLGMAVLASALVFGCGKKENTDETETTEQTETENTEEDSDTEEAAEA